MNRFIRKDFLVTIPDGWKEWEEMGEEENVVWLKKPKLTIFNDYLPHMKDFLMEISVSNPTDDNVNLDFCIEDKKSSIGDNNIISEEFIDLKGVDGYRMESVKKSKQREQYFEEVYIVFLKNKLVFNTICSSFINSPQQSTLYAIEDEIISIASSIKPRRISE
jgi:hypothetical protein